MKKSSYFGVWHVELVRGAGRLLDVVAARLRDLRGEVMGGGVSFWLEVIDGSRDVCGAD